MFQKNENSINNLDFIRYGRPIRPTRNLKPDANNQKKLISGSKKTKSKMTNKKKSAAIIKTSEIDNLNEVSLNTLQANPENIVEPKIMYNKNILEEKDASFNLDTLMSNDELARLEQLKNINSMISENYNMPVNHLSNSNHSVSINSIQNCSYFNLLPVSPSLCHNYSTTSFFNHNEMNVSNMLVSNVETSVDELFCDDL